MDDKDIFIEVYKIGLAKRLLNDKVQLDQEKQMISQIKVSCGSNYTSKLEGMLSDLNNSSSIENNFKMETSELPIEFNVKILTNGYWPKFTSD